MADEQGQNEVIAFTPDQTEQIQTVNERMMLLQEQLQAVIAKLTPEQKRAAEEGIKYIQALLPYIDEEIKDLRQQPGYKKYTRRTIGRYIAVDGEPLRERNGEPVDREIVNLIERAKEKLSAASDAEQLPKIQTNNKGVEKILFPIDKANNNIWKPAKWEEKGGKFTLKAEKNGSKKKADIICNIDFDALEQETDVKITKKLTESEKCVYIAVGSLFNAGYDMITVSQIYATMGGNGRPSAADIDNINNSVTKMAKAHIYLNNESENRLYPEYKKFIYDASLLPMERITAIVNGQITDGVIHLFREPPAMAFARERKQIITFSQELLKVPLNKTETILRLRNYLLREISRIKRSKRDNKMLYETIFEETEITTRMQRSRAKEKILVCLDYFKKKDFIEDYKESEEGITIMYANKKKLAAADEKP